MEIQLFDCVKKKTAKNLNASKSRSKFLELDEYISGRSSNQSLPVISSQCPSLLSTQCIDTAHIFLIISHMFVICT